MLTSIHLECDTVKTLGNSCFRDLYNMVNHIEQVYNAVFYIFTTEKNIDRGKFKAQNIHFYTSDMFGKISIKTTKYLLIHISGHGYQRSLLQPSRSKTDSHNRGSSGGRPPEKDGKDEYIRTNAGAILDDQLRKMIIDLHGVNISIIVDTCHSGTMFDLEKTDKLNCLYVGACRDEQYAICDIGEMCGFGGLLTITIIECGLIDDIIHKKNVQRLRGVLMDKLRHGGQTPVVLLIL